MKSTKEFDEEMVEWLVDIKVYVKDLADYQLGILHKLVSDEMFLRSGLIEDVDELVSSALKKQI